MDGGLKELGGLAKDSSCWARARVVLVLGVMLLASALPCSAFLLFRCLLSRESSLPARPYELAR